MYADHKEMIDALKDAQEYDRANRERAREAHHFLDKRDGQWDPDVLTALEQAQRPRYTLDQTNPIIDQIAGEMEQADFDIRVRPAGGDASKEVAKVFDGLIRNIETISNASNVYASAGREMVASGIGGWEVVHDYVDGDSFYQDLFIKPLWNFEDRVWFDSSVTEQDASDANGVWVLTEMPIDDYEADFPDGSGMSVTGDATSHAYIKRRDVVTVGRYICKKPVDKELVAFSDGSVREDDGELDKVLDELAQQGVVEVDRRTAKSHKIVSQMFDGKDWLTDEEDTVFDRLPIIPTYGNYKIREGQIIYRGHTEKLMDPARIYNALRSREVEEIIYSPRPKYWGTPKQREGHGATLATLNTNANPWQDYNPDPQAPGLPQWQGGAMVNPGLVNAVQTSAADLERAAGVYGIQQGNAEGPMSGVAIQALQNKGDNASIKYFKSQEIAICATARVLVGAIPKTYTDGQQARILNEDGSYEMQTINQRTFDAQTQTWVKTNDLTQGKYDVTCDVGPAFKNRQQETVKAINEIIGVLPEVGAMGADVLLNNVNSPQMDVLAERVRHNMVQGGMIPQAQLTDEELAEQQQQMMLAMQQPQQPEAADVLAAAETDRVRAETADVISKTQERQINSQIKAQEAAIKAEKNDNDAAIAAGKLAQDSKRIELDEMRQMLALQQQQMQGQQAMIQAQIDGQNSIVQALNTQAQTLKTLREAMGVDAVVSPDAAQAYSQQIDVVQEIQADQ